MTPENKATLALLCLKILLDHDTKRREKDDPDNPTQVIPESIQKTFFKSLEYLK